MTYSAVGLLVPLDKETGGVPDDHPLQVRRCHDDGPGCMTQSNKYHIYRQTIEFTSNAYP